MAHKVSQNIEKPLRASPSEDYHRVQQVIKKNPPWIFSGKNLNLFFIIRIIFLVGASNSVN